MNIYYLDYIIHFHSDKKLKKFHIKIRKVLVLAVTRNNTFLFFLIVNHRSGVPSFRTGDFDIGFKQPA
jgi:hypothetical protein